MQSSSTAWDLAGLLEVLRRRKRWIIGTAVVSAGVAATLSLLATPIYQSRAEVLVEPDVATTDPALIGRVAFLAQELQTQLQLVQSEAIATRVVERLSLGETPDAVLDDVAASIVTDTRVIRIQAADTDPDRAAQLAQAFAEEYLAFRREDAMERLQEASAELTARLERARAELGRLDDQIAGATGQGEIASLVNERDAVAEAVTELEGQLATLEASDPVARGGGRVIANADVPGGPSEPQTGRNVVVALLLGLGIGVILALAVDSVDDAVHSGDDAEAATGRPVLGRIPLASEDEGGDLPLLRDPLGLPAEAFRDLRTNLRFVGEDGPPSVVVLTSAIQGEGKSVISANLAMAAAAAGRRVVLVDADLRRPAHGRMFGHPGAAGLSTVLSGEHQLDEILFTVTGAGLDVVFSGDRPPNPSELLGTEAMRRTLRQLSERYDLVVVDAPPVLVVPDVLEFAASADTTLLVVELERATRREVRDATERLTRVNARVPGVVINRAQLDPSRYDYYYYAAE